jgi:acyl carrier protein
MKSNDVALVVCDAWLELTLPAGVQRLDVSVVPGARTLPRIAIAEAVADGAVSPRAVDRAAMTGLYNGLQAMLPLRPHESVLCIDGPARAWQWTQAVMALAAGGEVILAKPELARHGAGIIALLRGEKIRALHGSANMWLRILAELKGAVLPPLTAMVDVTESTPELVESLLKAGIKLISLYRPIDIGLPLAAGAVEDVQDATIFGRPLCAGSVKVAGPQGERLPISVAGELLSVSPADGKTAFSTGSQVRWRSDGVLQYLGEVAGTAYVEGHRVDLRAAEARLDRHPQVARSLLVVRNVSGGPTQLAAYIVPKEGGPTALAMAAQLKGCVPEELLPLQCVELPTIPTLPNGEVNLNALPSVSAIHPSPNQPSISKGVETEAERVVSDIWRTVLKVDMVGLSDNFFDLGGHSLLAMSVAAEVKSRLGVELNLRQLIFESLGQIAASLEQAMTKPPAPVIVPKRQGWLQKVVARLQA